MPSNSRRWSDLAYGLATVIFFGLYTPLAKRWLATMPPLLSTGFLYTSSGATLALLVAVRWLAGYRIEPVRRLELRDARIYGLGVACGVSASWLQLDGLGQVSGTVGSLLSNLEGVFMVAIALFFGESLRLSEAVGAAAILGGAVVLSLGASGGPATHLAGVVMVAIAYLGWASDNMTTQRLADRDPMALMATKCLLAGAVSLGLAWLAHEPLPPVAQIVPALLVGGIWWSGATAIFVLGLRALGGAKMGSLLFLTPFAGAVGSIVGLKEPVTMAVVVAAALMGVGALALGHGHIKAENSDPAAAPTRSPTG